MESESDIETTGCMRILGRSHHLKQKKDRREQKHRQKMW